MHRKRYAALLSAAAFCALTTYGSAALAQASEAAAPVVAATDDTVPSQSGQANKAVVVLDADAASSRIVATAGLGGLEVLSLDGKRQSTISAGEANSVDVRYGFPLKGQSTTLVVSSDITTNSLRFFAMNNGALSEVGARSVPLGFAVEGVCFYRHAGDGSLYVIAVGDGGEVDQQMVFATPAGRVDARRARLMHVPSPAEHCVADDTSGRLYVSEQATGIWSYDADPEADVTPTLVDAPRLGKITEEVAGLALYDGGEGARYLIASDASSGRLYAYDRDKDDAWLGAVSLSGKDGAAITEPGGLFSTSMALGTGLASGALVVADEDAGGGANYKVVSMDRLAGALRLQKGAPQDPRVLVESKMKTVMPVFETTPVPSAGDAADDPAIWANPANPALSVVIATDKRSGLFVHDMKGKILQHLPDGKMNNVDLRSGFMLGGKPVVLVTASNRTYKSIAIYRLDPKTRRLIDVADGVQPTDQGDPYGQCMYRSPKSGKTYVFINDSNGEKRQWELVDTGAGKVKAVRVRDFVFPSQVEGCVADDVSGTLFVNEEDIGLWRLSAEPDGGTEKTLIRAITDNPALKDDMEGIGLYDLGGGRGYLVASSQGNNTYAVFRREGTQEYVGSFAIVADAAKGIDGVSETDGLDVSSANLGPGFEKGALVAQDGRNVLPGELQNFKYVAWSDIAKALNLEVRK